MCGYIDETNNRNRDIAAYFQTTTFFHAFVKFITATTVIFIDNSAWYKFQNIISCKNSKIWVTVSNMSSWIFLIIILNLISCNCNHSYRSIMTVFSTAVFWNLRTAPSLRWPLWEPTSQGLNTQIQAFPVLSSLYTSLISFSSCTFPSAPYRIFLLFLPWLSRQFYLVAIEQQQ